MGNVTFDIKVTMKERWVNDFCSMLRYMEMCGNVGHSCVIGFYADGDGDFRPKFKINKEFEEKEGFRNENKIGVEVVYDAG